MQEYEIEVKVKMKKEFIVQASNENDAKDLIKKVLFNTDLITFSEDDFTDLYIKSKKQINENSSQKIISIETGDIFNCLSKQ